MRLRCINRGIVKVHPGRIATYNPPETVSTDKDRTSGQKWTDLRRNLWRVNPYCNECGRLVKLGGRDDDSFDLDHIVPLSEGGKNDHANLQILCVPCHKLKSSQESRDRNKVKNYGQQENSGGAPV